MPNITPVLLPASSQIETTWSLISPPPPSLTHAIWPWPLELFCFFGVAVPCVKCCDVPERSRNVKHKMPALVTDAYASSFVSHVNWLSVSVRWQPRRRGGVWQTWIGEARCSITDCTRASCRLSSCCHKGVKIFFFCCHFRFTQTYLLKQRKYKFKLYEICR